MFALSFAVACQAQTGQPTPPAPVQAPILNPVDAAAAGKTEPADDAARTPADREIQIRRPLTAAEERERQIRLLDPKSQADPRGLAPVRRNDQPLRQNTIGADSAPDYEPQGAVPRLPAITPDPPNAARKLATGTPADNNQTEGPKVLGADGDLPPAADYTGPTVLSRNYTLSRNLGQQRVVKWSWNIGFTQIWDSGLLGAPTTPAATAPLTALTPVVNNAMPVSSMGYMLVYGFDGKHSWKRDMLTAHYTGGTTSFSGAGAYSGTSHALNSKWTHILSRRMMASAGFTGQIMSRAASLENTLTNPATQVANLNLAASPITQLGDLGTHQMSLDTGLTWLKSSRLTISVTTGFTGLRRLGNGNLGSSGLLENLDANYRLNGKTTVGVYYAHASFSYSHRLNVTDTNTFGGTYSWAYNRKTQISVRAGITAFENEIIQQVRVDPVFAVLIGRGAGVVNSYLVSSSPDISVQFVRTFNRDRVFRAAYTESVAPGSATTGTSTQKVLLLNGNLKVFRIYGINVGAGTSSISGLAVNPGEATLANDNKFVSLSVTRTFNRNVTSIFTADYRTVHSGTDPNLKVQFRVTCGVSWTPGEGKLW